MKRRILLAAVGAAGLTGLAGCSGGGSGDGNGDGNGNDDTGTATTTEPTAADRTAEPTPEFVTSRAFETRSVECGEAENTATVRNEGLDGGGRLTVDGVIGGNSACYEATLDDVSYRAEATREGAAVLTVWVDSYVPRSRLDEACAECLVDIEYRAEVEYEGTEPFTVRVVHNGRVVERVRDVSPGGTGTDSGSAEGLLYSP
jgi:hypothetical protein